MIKFTKVEKAEIRKAYEVNLEGEKLRVVAIIGHVRELADRLLIYATIDKSNCEKWLVIEENGEKITEHDSLDDAKAYVRDNY